MAGNVTQWTNLVTSEHNQQPKYMAMLAAVFQPLADTLQTLQQVPADFDLDTAVGAQLDTIGLWVGVTRNLQLAITGVYFAWDTVGLGWDDGAWQGPGDPTSGLLVLPDAQYRTLLRARIANNQWNGTIPGAYASYAVLFAGTGYNINIKDNGDMTMVVTVTGPPLDAITAAIVTGGYLDLKPAGVLATYVLP